MTAYVVLRDHPLRLGQDGPAITLTDADVADTDRRRGQRESVVSVAAGERLTERPAAASPSGLSAGSTASGRRSPGSCWASPATTGSRPVSRPPPPWSTASQVSGPCRIHRN